MEGLLKNQPVDEGLKKVFLKLPELFGSLEQMQEAKKLTANPGALAAIERLEKVHSILESRGLEAYVSYDLGMLSRYQYYTGIILRHIPMEPGIILLQEAGMTSCWCSLERIRLLWDL